MTNSYFIRLTGLFLLAGFFYSCTTTQTNIEQLQAQGSYNKALSSIESQLSEDPAQPKLYITRAEINANLAKEREPEERADFYTETAESFDLAIEYGANESQLSSIDSLRQQLWKLEHNAGLEVTENMMATDRYDRAKTHFENALIIRPDAISSLKNLAVAHYNSDNIDEAINTLEKALEFAEDNPIDMLENLGYLYLEKGNPDQATHYYELANTDVEGNLNIAFGLVNAYISNGDTEEALDMLEPLVEEYPNNANLRNVYGTQLYEITSNIMDDLKTAYSDNETELAEQIRFEAEGMGDEAENQLIEAFKRDTTNTEYLESLAVFYNNLAAQYLSVLEVAFQEDQNALREKANMLIDFAKDYYEKLADIEPANSEYQQKLSTLNQLNNQ
ncbi:tetratricopeptide repeat protein [Gracilimonas sp.]|uniref:tetratricopeptide repeat protein n=1 Tax=Gracilimonas sp. TaxID=1974203 RepID=UPI002870C5DD|nr:tetratricopeptide repeat protein [Gracilimonas sp.]